MRIKRETLLNYLNQNLMEETSVNPNRVFDFNDKSIGRASVVYLCDRNLRVEDNFALNFAVEKSKELNKNLKIVHRIVEYESPLKKEFIDKQLEEVKSNFKAEGFEFVVIKNENVSDYLRNAGSLVIDFNPIRDDSFLDDFEYKIWEVDSTNIIPARFISDKQEYSAATFRVKVYDLINGFLTQYPEVKSINKNAKTQLDDFINNKLGFYNQYRNYPDKDCVSGLSKYLNWGFISAQRVVIDILKSSVSIIQKEAFLEEIIVRKELADNYCLYNKNYKNINGFPSWGRVSLLKHRDDFHQYVYAESVFENATTHDVLWNSAQTQLVKDGVIHGQLRMYWAKKILEWTRTTEDALDISVYLNDKYALDAPSPNGYVGILWSIGGLHDRPFRESDVTGQIRRMTSKGIYTKYGAEDYIKKYS